MSRQVPRFGWGHININVRDLDRSVEFYRKLGFEIFLPAITYLNLDSAPASWPLLDHAAQVLGLARGSLGRA
jgi:catechol 2,3-dioxygenase-like lactoylglutathione lyase family enzyme